MTLAAPLRRGPTLHQWVAWAYFAILLFAASLNYLPVPGLVDEEGLTLGIFALDIFDDLLHLVSALWAGWAAWRSPRAARLFLIAFGGLYLFDGLLGLATGSGCLDAGIFRWGIQDFTFRYKVFANLPHIWLGGVALAVGLWPWRREA